MTRSLILGCLALLVSGCGEQSTTKEPFAFDFHVFQMRAGAPGERGEPIVGAHVAVELASKVEQMTTDAAGTVAVTIPGDVDEVTITAAREGSLPVSTIYRATRAELAAELARSGQVYVTMEPAEAAAHETVRITASSSVPFCFSVDFWDWCGTDSFTMETPKSSDPLRVVAYSIDEQGCPLEMQDLELPDAMQDRSVSIVFDGTGSKDVARAEVTLLVEDDADSSYRRSGVHPGGRFPMPILDVTETRILGGACNDRPVSDGLAFTAAWFRTPAEEHRCLFAAFPNIPGSHSGDVMEVSMLRLQGDPETGSVYTVLDTPRMVQPASAPTLASTFRSQPPKGAATHDVVVLEGGFPHPGRELWRVHSFRDQPLRIPVLPIGYDRAQDWPTSTAAMFRLRTCSEDVPVHSLWTSLPGQKCALSNAVTGKLVR